MEQSYFVPFLDEVDMWLLGLLARECLPLEQQPELATEPTWTQTPAHERIDDLNARGNHRALSVALLNPRKIK